MKHKDLAIKALQEWPADKKVCYVFELGEKCCALGAMCKAANIPATDAGGFGAWKEVEAFYGLTYGEAMAIARLSDDNNNFDEVIKYIEELPSMKP